MVGLREARRAVIVGEQARSKVRMKSAMRGVLTPGVEGAAKGCAKSFV